MTDAIPTDLSDRIALLGFLGPRVAIHIHRGELEAAKESFSLFPQAATSDDVQEHTSYHLGLAAISNAEGRHQEALEAALEAFAARSSIGISQESVKEAYIQAIEAAFAMNDLAKVEELLREIEPLPRGKVPPFLRGICARFRSRLAMVRGEHGVEPGLKTAAGMFRELGSPLWLAVTLLEHGQWLARQGRGIDAKPLLDEAREIFERLRAQPWLDRLEEASAGVTPPVEDLSSA
jgi:tetratricopeptide (TPR) repeat protein